MVMPLLLALLAPLALLAETKDLRREEERSRARAMASRDGTQSCIVCQEPPSSELRTRNSTGVQLWWVFHETFGLSSQHLQRDSEVDNCSNLMTILINLSMMGCLTVREYSKKCTDEKGVKFLQQY
jgi:hypothetical protein